MRRKKTYCLLVRGQVVVVPKGVGFSGSGGFRCRRKSVASYTLLSVSSCLEHIMLDTLESEPFSPVRSGPI